MFRKLVTIGIVAVAALSAGSALARDETGTITNIDAKADQITLSTGTTINLPEHIEVESLKVGERVSVKYSVQKSGRVLASQVRPAK
jgi:Cu/Ag efflux protein CusF